MLEEGYQIRIYRKGGFTNSTTVFDGGSVSVSMSEPFYTALEGFTLAYERKPPTIHRLLSSSAESARLSLNGTRTLGRCWGLLTFGLHSSSRCYGAETLFTSYDATAPDLGMLGIGESNPNHLQPSKG